MLGLAGVLLGIVLHFFVREPRRNEAERAEAGRELPEEDAPASSLGEFLSEFFAVRTAWLLVSAYFGANLVSFVFLTWMPTFLKEKFGLNLALAGLGATFFIQVASIFGSSLGGIVSDRWSLRRPEGRILVQALSVLAGTPFVFLCGYTRSPWVLMACLSGFGLCKGVYDSNLTASFYDVISPGRRATATGVMNFVGWIGAGLGAIAIGVAVDHRVTMSAAISSTAVIYFLVAATLRLAAAAAPPDIRLQRRRLQQT